MAPSSSLAPLSLLLLLPLRSSEGFQGLASSLTALLFTRVRGRGQPVEKVVVGPVGGPKEARNQPKTLQRRRFQRLNRGQNRARRSFSTGWGLRRSSQRKL